MVVVEGGRRGEEEEKKEERHHVSSTKIFSAPSSPFFLCGVGKMAFGHAISVVGDCERSGQPFSSLKLNKDFFFEKKHVLQTCRQKS